jgi:hypothetical protein
MAMGEETTHLVPKHSNKSLYVTHSIHSDTSSLSLTALCMNEMKNNRK